MKHSAFKSYGYLWVTVGFFVISLIGHPVCAG
jgi:hypothetical protein